MKKILEIKEKCTACMACYNICPVNAITMQEDKEGFWYPEIDESTCTNCLLCEKVCPELRNEKIEKALIQQAYYGWHNNVAIREKSSSGGAFSAFAEWVLDHDGIVFGAVFNDKQKKVIHQPTEEVDLDNMRKSKYVQSYIGNTFKKTKDFLEKGKHVLFVGTPCQIAGLQTFLGQNYETLITCDFICHGVPPMKMLKDNLRLLEKKYHIKVINFDFRPKVKSWSYDYFSIFSDRQEKSKINIPWRYDSYFRGFMENVTLRKSCYRCNYSASQHWSDISLADYWGYRRYNEKIYDNRGLSLIIANTERGNEFIRNIDKRKFTFNQLEWKYADYVYFERNNENYNIEKRNAFFDDYVKYGYKKGIQKHHLATSNLEKLKKRLVSVKKIWR